MTFKKLKEKLLAKGFRKFYDNAYIKEVEGTRVEVHLPEVETLAEGEKWFLPYFTELTKYGKGFYNTWTANGINIALSKRGYFK